MIKSGIDTTYDDMRSAHQVHAPTTVPFVDEALSWDRGTLERHQSRLLNQLIHHARQRSAQWRDRLADLPDQVTLEHLPDIPILTKRHMMDNWSALLTVPDITLDEAYEHLDGLEEDRYFKERCHLIASGGSSGEPALFLYDWDGWAGCTRAIGRYMPHLAQHYPEWINPTGPSANVGADRASHMTVAMATTFGYGQNQIPVTLPLEDIVSRLNSLQPVRLSGYPSMMLLLTEEAAAGRLQISPAVIQPSSEPLTPEIREAIIQTWQPSIMNIWGCSEACAVGNSFGPEPGMYLNEDLVIVEAVDHDNQPVAPGTTADKVLLTNLFNKAQPLIRYELTDRINLMREPSPVGFPFRRIDDIEGRTDDVFLYQQDGSTVPVHPILFRGPIAKTAGLLEFQVFQTQTGAHVHYLSERPIDESNLMQRLTESLQQVGLHHPLIQCEQQSALKRGGVGKLRRFHALRAPDVD
ncbi:MAG: hypothetical protein AAF525_07575 [Pseudomonadota bacterium]